MPFTARAASGRGKSLAAGILFASVLMVWWGVATVAQQPPASLGADSSAGPVDAAVSPAVVGAETSPTAAADAGEKPPLAELMRSVAAYERVYFPFHVRTRETYRMAKDIPDEVRKRYPWGDGRQHESVVTSDQTAPRKWTRTEVRIADGQGNGIQRQVCGPEGLETFFESGHSATPVTEQDKNPPRFVTVSPLLGVFPLRMTHPSEGILLSEYYSEDPSRVTLAWEGVYAKLSFQFGPDAPRLSRYELWLTPVGGWHPSKLRWYSRAEDLEFDKEWEVKTFLQTPSTRVRQGTIRCRDRVPDAVPGAAENRSRPIAYSIEFHVEESVYGERAETPVATQAPRSAPTRPGAGENVPQDRFLPNPVGNPPTDSALANTPGGVLPEGFAAPNEITVDITPEADRSPVMRHVLNILDRAGTKITAADPKSAPRRTELTAVIGARQDAAGEEIVRLVQTLQTLGVRRFSLWMTPEKRNSAIVVAPADATWRTVQTLLEELKKRAGFDVDVRVAANNDPLTPAIPFGEPLPSPPPPLSANPASPGSPTAPLSPTPPTGTLPPGVAPSPNPIEPPTADGPPAGALPSLDAAPPIPPSTALPPPGPIPNLLPSPAAGGPPGGELPSLEPPPISPGPGLAPDGPPFAPPSPGSPAVDDPKFDPSIVDPPRNRPLKVFLLRHASATEAGRIVQQLYGPRINLALDERTNSLLVNAYDAGALKDLEELLKVLDVPERRVGPGGASSGTAADPMVAPTDFSRPNAPLSQPGSPSRNTGGSSMLRGQPPSSQVVDPNEISRPNSPLSSSELTRKLAAAEEAKTLPPEARALLQRLFDDPRERTGDPHSLDPDGAESASHDPSVVQGWNARAEQRAAGLVNDLRQVSVERRDPEKLRELRDLVRLQFHLRQLQQRTELSEFVRRLERIRESIETRERIAGKIVDRRVEELLDPALAWKPPTPDSLLPGDEMTPPGPRTPDFGRRAPSASRSLPPGGGAPLGVGPRRPPGETPVPNEFQSETTFPGFNPFGGSSSWNNRRSGGAPAPSGPSLFQGQGRPSLPTTDIARPSPAPSVDEPAWANLSGTWKISIMQDGSRDLLALCDGREAGLEIHGNVLGLYFRMRGREVGRPLWLKFSSAERPRLVDVVTLSSDGKPEESRGALSCDGERLQLCFGRPGAADAPKEIAPAENVTYIEAYRTGDGLPQAAAPDSLQATILHRNTDQSVEVGLQVEHSVRPGDRLKVFSGKARIGEVEVTKMTQADECTARILSEVPSMPIRTGDRVERDGGPQPSPFAGSQQSPQSKGAAKKSSVGVQFDLGNPAGQLLWIEGRGGVMTSRAGKMIQTSCGSRLRLRIRGIPKHEEENVFLTLEVQDEKSLEASKVIETVATNTIPLRITEEDLEQVFAENLVTKVVYRPHDLTRTGASLFDTVVSSKLEPGSDPRTEAEKRGTVVAMIRLSRGDESPKAEVREMPSQKPAPVPGLDGEARAVPDTSQAPKTDAEKAVARIVLVFAGDEARRAFPVLLVNVSGKTLAVTTSSATVVPDGVGTAIDRQFLEIPGRAPVAVTYEPKWQDPKKEFYVFECAEELPGQPLEVPPDLDAGETLSAILPGSQSELRVKPEAARLRAVNQGAKWLVPTNKETREHTGLWELDRALPEGTPLFRGGQLAGVTLLGTRFLGEKAEKSYVIPGQRIIEFRAKLGAIASKEESGTPIVPPESSLQDPAVPESR